ncbi:hypothetical protein O3G_MSEX012056 [Manduca sexta]|uniref:Tetraspanin n=1 Tax=Manduca sexta TaxID=7130 RepID=A0A921ZNK8_MANSE|nr:hypothetical protein O3G_MSEX012056 [Manduca sexta]
MSENIPCSYGEPTDDQLITKESFSRNDMGKTDKAQGNEPTTAEGAPEVVPEAEESGRRANYLKKLKTKKGRRLCTQIAFVALNFVSIVTALSLIAVTVLTSLATKVFDTEQSNRLVGMVILAVTAAVAISMGIYAVVAVFKKQTKPIHAATIVLLILAAIQSILAGVSVKVSPRDELHLGKSLADSFKLARENNPRHVKLWAATQYDLNCCGIISADDYRDSKTPYYFPPNVPISCCPTFDPDRSELVQERDREVCKARKTFYDLGCRDLIINVFKETSHIVIGVLTTLIILELFIALLGWILCRNQKSFRRGVEDEEAK